MNIFDKPLNLLYLSRIVIYLDNNATTKPLPEVVKAMLPFYTEFWGNPSSIHHFGAQVAPHIDKAREQVAQLISAQRASEITFTSGGTESNNLALRGVLQANPAKRHILTTPVEHSSVLRLCQELEKENFEITYLPVQPNGQIDCQVFENAIRKDTALATIMWANNETGVLFPMETLTKICEEKNLALHSDATQAVGKIPIDLRKTPVSLLTIAGHKIHAPKGIGALYVRRGVPIKSQMIGGSQERSRRAGTENIAGMIGLGKACQLAQERLAQKSFQKEEKLRDTFEETLRAKFNFLRVNGKESRRIPNTSSLSFEGLDGNTICLLLSEKGIAVSTGSACSAGSLEPSHVLKAMGLSPKRMQGTVRFSLSFETTAAEIEQTITALEKIIVRLSS